MSLDGQEELKVPAQADRTSSDSGSNELAEDSQSVNSIGNPHDLSNDDLSVGSVEIEDNLSRSLGRLSVHSVSRLIHADPDRSQESDASLEDESQTSSKTHPSSSSLQVII